jgi:hypothetical protein
MKKSLFLSLIAWIAVTACNNQGIKAPEGTWKMVRMQMIEGSKVTDYFSSRYKISQIKMWSGDNFMFVGKYEVDTATSYRFGAGKFTLDGNLYVENILYHFDPAYEGTKNKIWLEIKNDTLMHVFPVNDVGEPNKTRHWIEKYVRLR